MKYVYILGSYGYEDMKIIKVFESLDDAKNHIPGLTWVDHGIPNKTGWQANSKEDFSLNLLLGYYINKCEVELRINKVKNDE